MITTDDARVVYTGAGTRGPFTIPYYFLADADLQVVKTLISTGAETVLALTTDYTLTGAGDEDGGALTLTVAHGNLSSSYKISIINNLAATQGIRYPRNDKFPAQTHERGLDRLTMLVQRLVDRMDRALQLSDGDTTSVLGRLPNAIDRASKFFAWNASGQPIASAGTTTGAPVETVQQVVNSVAALKALAIPAAAVTVFVLGYYAPLDLGGGAYYWDSASTATDNGGSVLRPDSAPASGRWRLIHTDQLSIGQFGAKADDATDTSPILQKVIDTAIPIVYINKGTFRCNSTVGKTWSALGAATTFYQQKIMGSGLDSVLKNYGNGTRLFSYDSQTSSEYVFGLEFVDFCIDGSGHANSGCGLWMTQMSDYRIRRVRFKDCRQGALFMHDGQAGTVSDDCFFGGCGDATYPVVHVELTTTFNLLGCRFTNNSGARSAVRIDEAYGTNVLYNTIESSGICVDCDPANAGATTYSTTIAFNRFEYPVPYHIRVGRGSTLGFADDVRIYGNTFSMSNLANVRGIFVERTTSCYIKENQFIANSQGTSYDIEFSNAAGSQIDCQLGYNKTASGSRWLLQSHAADPYLRPSFVASATPYSNMLHANEAANVILVQTPAYAATLTPDREAGGIYAPEALTGNLTIGAPSNAGGRLVFSFLQDGTGGRTVTWNAIFIHSWSDTGNTANRRSSIAFVYDGTNWIQDGAQVAWH